MRWPLLPQDLRLRLVAAFVIVAALSQLHDLATAAIALAGVGLIAFATGVERSLWRRLLHVESFVLLLFLTLPFTVPGNPVLTLGPLSASGEGVARAALIACKVSTSVLVLMTVLGSVEPTRLGAALHDLHVPETIVKLFVMTVRYLSLIRGEARRLHEAMRARAFRAGSNRHTWRSYGYLIGMLLVRALERAQRVEEAMLCRGYSGRFPHAALPAPGIRDWAAFAGLSGLAVATLLVDRI
ncbi:cobalt ECF transporter T component CbiQ [Roseibium sp.]|uniref:cobalt ECF transporter T component CbiQ n=1 Tax=Roseibium sp. TaxID=1936156 RepID=UPI003A9745CB